MDPGERINPGHGGTRETLRVVGPGLIVLGVVFMFAAMLSFQQEFESAQQGPFFGPSEPRGPDLFWLAFLGLPLVALGGVITKFAYARDVARYVAAEVAPVANDSLHYLAQAGGASAVAAAGAGAARTVVLCTRCGHGNPVEADFCNKCATPLRKSRACGACGELNDPDARFCDRCGRGVGDAPVT